MPLMRFNQQRFAMHGVGQKCFQQNDVFSMTVIGQECHRDDCTVCIPPFLSLNTVWCSTVLVMRTHVTMRRHADDSLMMLHTSEMRDVMVDLPMTEDSQLSDLSPVMIEIMGTPSSAQIRDVGG